MLVGCGGYVTGYFVATAGSTTKTDILERACRTMCDIFWITRMSWTRILALLAAISFSETRRNHVRPNQASVQGASPRRVLAAEPLTSWSSCRISGWPVQLTGLMCRWSPKWRSVCVRSRSGSFRCVSRLCDLEKGDRNGHSLQLNLPNVPFGKTTAKCAFCRRHCHRKLFGTFFALPNAVFRQMVLCSWQSSEYRDCTWRVAA